MFEENITVSEHFHVQTRDCAKLQIQGTDKYQLIYVCFQVYGALIAKLKRFTLTAFLPIGLR